MWILFSESLLGMGSLAAMERPGGKARYDV